MRLDLAYYMSVKAAHCFPGPPPTQCAFVNNRSNDMPCAFTLRIVLGVPNAPVQELLQECALIIHRDPDLFPSQRAICEI
jgi:hypothetical protein